MRPSSRRSGLGYRRSRAKWFEGDTAGYHYYPGRDRVDSWLGDAGLIRVDEAFSQHDGWVYRHLLVRGSAG